MNTSSSAVCAARPFAGDDDYGCAVTRELLLYLKHFAHQFGYQRRCWLVELHRMWTHCRRPGDCGPLLRSTRERVRVDMGIVAHCYLAGRRHLDGAAHLKPALSNAAVYEGRLARNPRRSSPQSSGLPAEFSAPLTGTETAPSSSARARSTQASGASPVGIGLLRGGLFIHHGFRGGPGNDGGGMLEELVDPRFWRPAAIRSSA